MADEVRIPIRGDSNPLGRELDKSEGLVRRFGGTVKNVFTAIGVMTTARRVFGFFKDSLGMAAEQEKSFKRLEQVIKSTGNTTGFTAAQLAAMADGLEDTVNIAGEAVMDAQSVLATFKNVRGDIFAGAIERAADLQEVLGTGLKGAVMTLGRALDNPITGLASLSRARINFTAAQKKTIEGFVKEGDIISAQKVILDELARKYGGTAAVAAQTAAGKMQHFHNVVENSSKAIGTALIPMLDQLSPLVESVGNSVANAAAFFVDEWLPGIRAGSDAVYEFFKPAIEYMQEASVAAFAFVQTAMTEWESGAELVMAGFQLAFVQVWEEVKHWLTVVIPDALAWFGQNWFSVLETAASYVDTVLRNMLTNVGEFLRAVKTFLTTGEIDFKFTALEKGFKNTIKELPEIAKRELSATEKALQDRIAQLNLKIIKTQDANEAKARGTIDKFFGKERAEDVTSNAKVLDPEEVKAMLRQKAKEAASGLGIFAGRFTRAGMGDEKKESRVGAMEDLESLNKRISQAAASKEDKVASEVRRVFDKTSAVAALEEKGNELLKEGNALSAKLFAAIPTLGGLL